jgi:hypothetical protein
VATDEWAKGMAHPQTSSEGHLSTGTGPIPRNNIWPPEGGENLAKPQAENGLRAGEKIWPEKNRRADEVREPSSAHQAGRKCGSPSAALKVERNGTLYSSHLLDAFQSPRPMHPSAICLAVRPTLLPTRSKAQGVPGVPGTGEKFS